MILGKRPGWQIAVVALVWIAAVLAIAIYRGGIWMSGVATEGEGSITGVSIGGMILLKALFLAFLPALALVVAWLLQRKR
jgi:hypothetical protein